MPVAPSRVVGHSPYARHAWTSPPVARRTPEIQHGSGAWFGVLLLLITFGLGVVAGYVISRAVA